MVAARSKAKAKPQPRELAGTTATIPIHERRWIDVEPSKQNLASYDLSKKVINLLRHNQTLQREDDGAIESNSIFEIIIHKNIIGLREAVGLPPLKKPRVHLPRRTGESSNDPVESSIPGNDDLYIDCYWSSEVPNDEILVLNKSTNTIVWSRLTEDEKSLFDDAKDKALLKYINRNAWRPVKRVTSNPKKTCPIAFALKWKNGTAHARVCLQGFKHEDSTTKLLHKESPTMSRIGRSFIFLVLVHNRWKASAADAADAFLQGMNVEDLGIDIFTDPVGDVRKRLQRLMNLAEDEVLKMLKSGFGDVRASSFVV